MAGKEAIYTLSHLLQSCAPRHSTLRDCAEFACVVCVCDVRVSCDDVERIVCCPCALVVGRDSFEPPAQVRCCVPIQNLNRGREAIQSLFFLHTLNRCTRLQYIVVLALCHYFSFLWNRHTYERRVLATSFEATGSDQVPQLL